MDEQMHIISRVSEAPNPERRNEIACRAVSDLCRADAFVCIVRKGNSVEALSSMGFEDALYILRSLEEMQRQIKDTVARILKEDVDKRPAD